MYAAPDVLNPLGNAPRRQLVSRPSRLYRIVQDQDASWLNFVSDEAKGKPKRGPHERDIRVYRGVSMYASSRGALAQQHRLTQLGSWIAEVSIPAADYVLVHKTLGPEHYSVIGLPRVLAQLVRSVESAR